MSEEVVQENNFLGKEKIGKLLRMFSIPCVLSLIIQALYNLVDQIFIGHSASLGATGNAATGIVYPLTVIALAIGLWLGDGAAACISLNQGRKDTKNTAKSVGTALTVGTILSVILMAVCFLFKDSILQAVGASGNILASASEYANFIIGGFFFFILACVINPLIRADGSPKFAMIAMVSGAIINIILDPIFIYSLNMGMTGAALATFLGQTITFVLHVVYLFKAKTFKLNLSCFEPNFKLLESIAKLGISSFLTQIAIVIISIVNNKLLFTYSYSSGYDVNITQGVITLAFKVFGIIISIAVGIAAGGQPILGYNYGAKNYKRVLETFKYILISTIIVGVVSTLLFELCPQVFLFIFGDGGDGVDPVAYENFTVLTFRIYLGFILLTCIIKVIAIFFQAIGEPIKSTLIAMARDVIFVVPTAIIFAGVGGIDLLLWSAPFADVLSFFIAICLTAFAVNKIKTLDTKTVSQKEYKFSILPSKKGFIITISREHGSSGKEIGRRLAKKLNIPFYDKELTALAAKESGLSNEFMESYEESSLPRINDLYLGLDPSIQARNAQTKILKKIADNGSCVIVGRAADTILEGEYPLIKIFVHASMDYRIGQIMKYYNDTKEEAVKNIEKSDKRRANFYSVVSGKKWGDYKNYDLMINGDVGIDSSVEIIANYVLKKEKINNY